MPDGSLRVVKSGGGAIDLAWSASCKADGTDYAVYEGSIGSWYSHDSAALCSTGGARAATLTPMAGSRYYLVVPKNYASEGGYGTASSGAPIPRGANPCVTSTSPSPCP